MLLSIFTLSGDNKNDIPEKDRGRFPIHWKCHHIVEMLLAVLPRMELDGSSKLVIAARRVKNYPYEQNTYTCMKTGV